MKIFLLITPSKTNGSGVGFMKHIYDNILKYERSQPVRFHMPGHKGRGVDSFLDPVLPFDVTELVSTDNLYEPISNGFVEKELITLQNLYKTHATVISASGATLCIQSAVYCAQKNFGNSFLVDSRCHKSVCNALALTDADVSFFNIDCDIESILSSKKHTVIVTSPDYYGKIADIEKIASICHKYDCRLIIDNSHGSHLKFYGNSDLHPLTLGADIVIDSLHKTLPILTGGALLHSNCELTEQELLFGMRLFGSTSPSYLISSSVSYGIDIMAKKGEGLLNSLLSIISDFETKLSGTDFYICKYSRKDPFRPVIRSRSGCDMKGIDKILIENNIFSEFSDSENLVLIPSVNSTQEEFDILFSALLTAQKANVKKAKSPPAIRSKDFFRPDVSPRRALFSRSFEVATSDSLNMIAAELKYVYPPGIPYIIPGCKIDKNMIEMLIYCNEDTVKVIKE